MSLEEVIRGIELRLPKWRAWFPSEDSTVEIPRRDLLLLVEAARAKVPRPEPATHTNPVVGHYDREYQPLVSIGEKLKLRIGDEVAVEMDTGEWRAFTVRAVPWQLACGVQWVIGLVGVEGGYDLGRVRARKVVAS